MTWFWRGLLIAVVALLAVGCSWPRDIPPPPPAAPYTGPYYLESCSTGLTWYTETRAGLHTFIARHHLKGRYIVLLPSDLALTNAQRKARCHER